MAWRGHPLRRFMGLTRHATMKGEQIMRLNHPVAAVILLSAALIHPLTSLRAQSETEADQTPTIGVLVDPNPLPELLTKHLRLEPDQGLAIRNVMTDSPADKAGLDKDDILLRLNGETISDYETFVQSVRRNKIGDEITLDTLHLGQPQKVTLQLAPRGQQEWKYPMPQRYARQAPGRAFRLRPGERDWQPMPHWGTPMNPPGNSAQRTYSFHSYSREVNGDSLEITIEGDPANPKSVITVKTEKETITANVEDIDQIPDQYRDTVKEVLEQARQEPSMQLTPPDDWFNGQPPFGMPNDEMFNDMQQRMKELQDQLDWMRHQQDQMQQQRKDKNEKIKI